MASFDLAGGSDTLGGPAAQVYVCRYSGGNFTWLPNVVCLGVSERYGVAPPTATFKYLFDDAYAATNGWPGRIEDVWPIDASGPYVVSSDDRLVCMVPNPDGSMAFLFDGFAQIPQADVTPMSEQATFTAIGVAIREFDNPISGRTQRNGDPTGIQDTSGNSDVSIDRPCHFNPATKTSGGDNSGYQGNKTPGSYDTDDGTHPAHPVFADPAIRGRTTSQSPAYWSIADAIKYLLAEYNASSTYVSYPAFSTLDETLSAVYATDDTGPLSIGDVTSDPLLIRDFDASNKPYPEAIAELLAYAGFVMRWDLDTGTDGSPTTYMRFYRKDMLSTSPVKQLYLDTPGNSLAEGSRNNVVAMHLARDANAIVNAWQVETGQRVVEVSVVLAPLFQPATGDAAASADPTSGRNKYKRTSLEKANASADDRRKYRWHGVDELGEGYYKIISKSWTTADPFDFSAVFPADTDGTPSYVRRYRPGLGHAVALDTKGRPLRARLDVAFGNAHDGAAFWSSSDSATWYNVAAGWRLLPDRLGIEITADDPNKWSGLDKEVNGGVINAVEWWADPTTIPAKLAGQTTNGNPPALRLTVAIEDDLRMPISAGKRVGSPTKYARWRVADARDHFQYLSIDPSSANFASQGGTGTTAKVIRDDTNAADNHARLLRSAHEMPPLAGSVTLPGINLNYEIGDRVSSIVGRNINLGQNAGSASGEGATVPVVVGREYQLDGAQRTVLHLSDLRADRGFDRNAW